MNDDAENHRTTKYIENYDEMNAINCVSVCQSNESDKNTRESHKGE